MFKYQKKEKGIQYLNNSQYMDIYDIERIRQNVYKILNDSIEESISLMDRYLNEIKRDIQTNIYESTNQILYYIQHIDKIQKQTFYKIEDLR